MIPLSRRANDFDIETCKTVEDFEEAQDWLNEELTSVASAISLAKLNSDQPLLRKLLYKHECIKSDIKRINVRKRHLRWAKSSTHRETYLQTYFDVSLQMQGQKAHNTIVDEVRKRLRPKDEGGK